MVRTHIENCKECGKTIANWSMFDNLQYLDEFVCTGKIQEEQYRLPDGSQMFFMDGGDGTTEKYMKKHGKKVFVDVSCLVKYCGDCAEKLDYKCLVCSSSLRIDCVEWNSKRKISLFAKIIDKESEHFGEETQVRAINPDNSFTLKFSEYSSLDNKLHKYKKNELKFNVEDSKINDLIMGRLLLIKP